MSAQMGTSLPYGHKRLWYIYVHTYILRMLEHIFIRVCVELYVYIEIATVFRPRFVLNVIFAL